jgi:hypothetical protein
MSDYRVRVDDAADPLAIDVERCRSQRFQVTLGQQVAITLVSVGLWLPGFIVWLATSHGRIGKVIDGYVVRVSRGTLVAGNSIESRTVPLDAIADISVTGGITIVSVRGAQPLRLYGLRDPMAAAAAILEARDAHLRTLRADVRVDAVLEDQDADAQAEGRRRSTR